MLKKSLTILFLSFLVLLIGCKTSKIETPIAEDSSNTSEKELTSYIGVYETDDKSFRLTIFDISQENNMIFELNLIDNWVVVDETVLTDNHATFKTSNDNINVGTFDFHDETITLNIINTQEFLKNSTGTYTLKRVGDITAENSYFENQLCVNNHEIFTGFVKNELKLSEASWSFLGTAYGKFDALSYENLYQTDLYKLNFGNNTRYYTVSIYNETAQMDYGVREIVSGTTTNFLFMMTKNALLDTRNPMVMDEILIKAFLHTKSFVDFETKQWATIHTLSDVNSFYPSEPDRYTTVDLDGNGVEELIVQYHLNGATAIINFDGDKFVAYSIPFRGIIWLKTDGTMGWSSGASENGFQRLSFSPDGLIHHNITDYDEATDTFYIDSVAVSRQEYSDYLERQDLKEDVTWISIN